MTVIRRCSQIIIMLGETAAETVQCRKAYDMDLHSYLLLQAPALFREHDLGSVLLLCASVVDVRPWLPLFVTRKC